MLRMNDAVRRGPGLDHERIRRSLVAWQAGEDREANFRILVESTYTAVRIYFVKRGFSAEQARDLTQETFFGIYKGLAGFRGEARFDTWLYQIAANTCRKSLRNRQVLKRRLDLEAKSMTDLPDDVGAAESMGEEAALGDLLRKERSERLRNAIAALPVRMRSCLAMRVYQEHSYLEIAAAMQLSVETVKAHLYQARKRLREELADPAQRPTRKEPR